MRNITAPKGNWLSALALWAIIGAWGACGVYGWINAADGAMRWICIALNVGCAVFAARAVKNSAASAHPILLMALGAACLMFDGWSGAQGLSVSEGVRWAPYEIYAAAKAEVSALDAQIAAVRPVPLSDEAGRVIGPQRFRELGAQRQAEIARLQGLRDAIKIVPVAQPSAKMPWYLELAVATLVALLELLGFATIASSKTAPAAEDNVIDISAAARALVGKRKDRQPA